MKKSTTTSQLATGQILGGFFIIWGLLLLSAANLGAGVLVAPTIVVLDEKNKTGRLNLENPSDKPAEVTIGFGYGLPQSDSLGNVSITLRDSNISDPRSAMEWVKAFPRKVVLPPRGSQVVRVVARPPKDLEDGEYWARIVVESQEGSTELPPAGGEGEITTSLNMIMRTAIMLKYRTGDLVAQVELANTSISKSDSLVEVILDLVNRGNVSYLAKLTCRLLDADNREISHRNIDIAVYRDLKRRVDLPILEGDFKEPFQIDLVINSRERRDIAREDMIYGNEIKWSAAVE